MNIPNDKRRKSPIDRFRGILSAEEKNQAADETITPSVENAPKTFQEVTNPADQTPPAITASTPPAFTQASVPAQVASNTTTIQTPRNNRFLPIFWTIASIVSLTCNVLLVILLVVVLRELSTLNAAHLGPSALGGLYNNFERMDQAHIKTTLPVQTNIPLNLSIPVQTSTSIKLDKPVSFPGAYVTISTALGDITAPASVSLPSGTSLDVGILNFDVPVHTNVPINLNVPVDIAIRDTDLHPAIIGLQDTIRPLYCVFSPDAVSLSGEGLCK